jgi:acetyl esterase/lipase
MQGPFFRPIRALAAAAMAALALTAAPTAAAQAAGTGAAPRPVTEALPYFDVPRISSVRVSPSNTHAAFLWVGNAGRQVLAVIELADLKNLRVLAGNKHLDIRHIHWVNDRRLVFDAIPPELEFYEGEAGTFAIDLDGQRQRLLASWTNEVRQDVSTRIPTRVLPYGWGFFSALPGEGDEALFYELDKAVPSQRRIRALARLNTANGLMRRVSTGMPEHSVSHITDASGELRIVVTEHSGRARVHHRPGAGDQWEVVEDLPLFDSQRMHPLYIEADGNWVVRSRRGSDADALFVFNPKTRKLDPEPLVAAAGFDMGEAIETDPAQKMVVGVHIETSQPQTVWLDARLGQLQQAVDAALPAGRMNHLLCGNCLTAQRFVVHSQSDRMPGEYFVFDTVAKQLVPIATRLPELPEASQGARTFHRVAARDGLSLPVVVTHPLGVDAKTPRPLVVLVHGGPQVRGGSRAWSAEPQFLAARGYRVLEVEYRGSTGFGEKHMRAGFRQWGQAMQDDLADAVAWAVREGMGEPGRACIVGGSYGGYAALMGVVRHPELYRCAASVNGVTDTARIFDRDWTDINEQARRHTLTETLGDPAADKAMLERYSPLNRVADIRAPLLVTWGEKDVRVDPAHSKRFVAAARAAGLTVESHEYRGEGHGFYLVENQVDHAERLARFLDKHLGSASR